MKICNVVGARPQFIKYFPISKIIKNYNSESIDDILVHTGQHYDYNMSKVFFDTMGISEPNYHLNVGSGQHGIQTGKMLEGLECIYLKEKPDIVIVYGDTNSTLAGAIAAAKLKIPVAHIEAGLRSFNKKMPEEMNRIMTDHISSILFCPCENAVNNLLNEGFSNIINNGKLIAESEQKIQNSIDIDSPPVINSGDVMFDALLHAKKISDRDSKIVDELNLNKKKYGLMTLHRAENTDDESQFKKICRFVNEITKDIDIVFPVHPRTKNKYKNLSKYLNHVKIIEPVNYFDLLFLLDNSQLLLTDSGGMQKEAYWLRVPCITLRNETEWIETINDRMNVLYTDFIDRSKLLWDKKNLSYGNGRAAQHIISSILNQKNIN